MARITSLNPSIRLPVRAIIAAVTLSLAVAAGAMAEPTEPVRLKMHNLPETAKQDKLTTRHDEVMYHVI